MRRKTSDKHSILIRSDLDSKCFETFKFLHQNLLMENGYSKWKQIYKII